MKVKSLNRVRLLATPWTAAYQGPLPMGFFQARALEWGPIALSDLFPSAVLKCVSPKPFIQLLWMWKLRLGEIKCLVQDY